MMYQYDGYDDECDLPDDIYDEPCDPLDEDDFLIDGVGFAVPGGESALRAETPSNPRNLPCPTCGRENVLTPLDVAADYQCNACAREAERGW
jgi:hypothetical protein